MLLLGGNIYDKVVETSDGAGGANSGGNSSDSKDAIWPKNRA